jgi:hypothetical protein
MARKRKRILDQIYNGAFENAELSPGSKAALMQSGLILLLGVVLSTAITKNK